MGRPFDPGFSARTAGPVYGGRGWKPLEIGAMVAGFVVFWPVGLAVVGFKVWQKKTGYPGDLFTFARETWDSVTNWSWSSYGATGGGFAARSWRSAGFGSSGNRAFDDWREGELARLEEERRKLVAAEREFAEFLETLRRARDREEFDRFMQERRAQQGSTSI
jgi:hypothetical protein